MRTSCISYGHKSVNIALGNTYSKKWFANDELYLSQIFHYGQWKYVLFLISSIILSLSAGYPYRKEFMNRPQALFHTFLVYVFCWVPLHFPLRNVASADVMKWCQFPTGQIGTCISTGRNHECVSNPCVSATSWEQTGVELIQHNIYGIFSATQTVPC